MQNRLLPLLFSFAFILPARAQWVGAPAPAGGELHHICFPTAQTGYTCSSAGYIYKTTDGGQTWVEKLHPGQLTGFESYVFNDMQFVSEQVGFLVGQDFWAADYLILRTFDGGGTWQPFTYEFGLNIGECNAVDFPTPMVGYVVGDFGLVFKTTNGGVTWSAAGSTPGALSENLIDVDFVDTNTGYVLNHNGKLYRTTAGGLPWQANQVPIWGSNSIQFFDTQTGYVNSDDGVYKTDNGGLLWWFVKSFQEGGFGWAKFCDVNTGYGLFSNELYKTVDGGQHWFLQEINLGIPPGTNTGINDLFCTDADNGWLCGFRDQNGTPVSMIAKTTTGGGLGLIAAAVRPFLQCPGDSAVVTAEWLGDPTEINWYLDGILEFTGPGPKTFPNLPAGLHVVRVEGKSANNIVAKDVSIDVKDLPDYSSTFTFSINTQPCSGDQATVYTEWNYLYYPKLLIFLDGNFIDTARFETDFNGYRFFKLPPVADTTTFQIKVAYRCGDLPVTEVTVKPQPLPFDDLDLTTAQEILCEKPAQIPIVLKNSQPGVLYDLIQNGEYIAYNWGNGEDLTFNVIPYFTSAVFKMRASQTCLSYLKDSLIVQIEEPDARFGVNGVNLPVGTPVEVNFAGTEAASYEWNFGAGATPAASTQKEPGTILYNGEVNTQIQLITTGSLGCKDTTYKNIALYAPHHLSEYWALEMDAGNQFTYTGNSVSVDPEQNVVFNGAVPWTPALIPSRAGTGVTVDPGHGVYKYDRFGVLQWVVQHENKSLRSTDLVTDHEGNVIGLYTIEGLQANDFMYFGSTDEKRKKVLRHWTPVIAKWDPNGKLMWVAEVKICNQGGWTATSLELDADDNIYILANGFNPWHCNYVTHFISADSSTIVREIQHDFLAKLSPDGIFQWVYPLVDGSGNPAIFPKDIAVDAQGDILIGGEVGAIMAKYNQQGELLWKLIPDAQSPDPYFTLWHFDVDETGNTYINGLFRGYLRFGNITLFDMNGSSDWDHFIMKISPNGEVLWAKNAATDGIVQANAVAVKGNDLFMCLYFTRNYTYENLSVATDGDLTAGGLWMQLSTEDGSVKRYALLNTPNPNIDYAIYSNTGSSIAVGPNDALHLLGQIGYYAEWVNTPLTTPNYLFLAKIPELPGIVGSHEPINARAFTAEVAPNPSASATTLMLDLPEDEKVSAWLNNAQGQQRLLFKDRAMPKGRAHLLLEDAPPGVYFLELRTERGERRSLKWVRLE